MITFFQSRHNPRISLSGEEIFHLSEKIKAQYRPKYAGSQSEPPSVVKFSAQELLSISTEINNRFSIARYKPVSPVAACTLMTVDPGHLHAYWTLDDQQPGPLPHRLNDNCLILRVFYESDNTGNHSASTQFFDVPVEHSQRQQTIALPEACSQNRYSAAIGYSHVENQFVAFAHSPITCLPRVNDEVDRCGQQRDSNTADFYFMRQHHSGRGLLD